MRDDWKSSFQRTLRTVHFQSFWTVLFDTWPPILVSMGPDSGTFSPHPFTFWPRTVFVITEPTRVFNFCQTDEPDKATVTWSLSKWSTSVIFNFGLELLKMRVFDLLSIYWKHYYRFYYRCSDISAFYGKVFSKGKYQTFFYSLPTHSLRKVLHWSNHS